MVRIKFNLEHIKFISLFGKITRVPAQDCIIDEKTIIFIVKQGNGSKAIGKAGINTKKLEKIFSKRIQITELREDLPSFIGNLCYPLKNLKISREEEDIIIIGPDTKTKGLLIGRNSQNLKKLEENAKRYFKFNKIKVK